MFDLQFFNAIHGGSLASARIVVPRLKRLLHPKSVVDVGCGTGLWLAEFIKHGVRDVVGIDGPWTPESLRCIPQEAFLHHDLTVPLSLFRRFDLVLCLGVAAHLHESAAECFIETLTSLGPVILFSAPAINRGIYGPANTRASEWWDGVFAARGYRPRRGFGARLAGERNVDRRYSQHMAFYVQEGLTTRVDLELCYLQGTPQTVRLDRLLPVIMTCARDVPLMQRFVDSYEERVGTALPRPLFSIDLAASSRLPGGYLSLLERLKPAAAAIHPRVAGLSDRESINDAAFFALANGMEELEDRDHLLFLEDDIIFSSQFVPFLSQLHLEPDAGLYTFYRAFGRPDSAVIEPRVFFGTQCLLFPRACIQELLENRHEMDELHGRPSTDYDVLWARSLEISGYKLYGSSRSYVQHVGAVSRIGSPSHSGHAFVE